MSHTVTIQNNGIRFNANTNETILEAARRQGISLPYGCAGGICGACVFTLVEGQVEYRDDKPFAIAEEDIDDGRGLCCIVYPLTDIVIDLDYPDEDFEPWF
jgi:ferredoxin